MACSYSSHPSPLLVGPSLCSSSASISNSRVLLVSRGNEFRKKVCGLASGFRIYCRNADVGAPSKIVTFVGKGGVGKTFSAVLAAQYYASLGLRTALAVQSQDPTAEFLLGSKLGTYSAPFRDGNLSAFRLDATKLLEEPWSLVKQADAELKFSQGALDEVVSEELSILPGMDSILAIGLLERLSGFTGDSLKKRGKGGERYDIVVYDGASSEETLRIFGSAERVRWYLRRLRSLADKTDAGRVALPSILKSVETSILGGPGDRSTPEIWSEVDSIFSKTVAAFADRTRFGCYLVTNPRNKLAHECALRYWGCAMQAGVHVTGAVHMAPRGDFEALADSIQEDYSPLTLAEIPHFSFGESPNWKELLSNLHPHFGQILQDKAMSPIPPPVAIDKSSNTITLFLPGFPKSEVKLSQWRGNTELLVEAGDQRRSISLPPGMQGKVTKAKFENKSLVVTIGRS
ncbi:unnamed protein product [Calypogeia fissa]